MANSKLYRVTLRGMHYSSTGGVIYGIAYVVAENTEQAYKKVRDSLEKRGIGFKSDRELLQIELLAEGTNYPECNIILYV